MFVKNESTKEKHAIVQKLGRLQKGTHIAKYGLLTNLFGCNTCTWRSTPYCPHGKKGRETHINKICSQRALYVKEVYKYAGTKTRFFQAEELAKLKLISDKMLMDFNETGELHDKFDKISRNLITILDKMRRQDEGIKIQQDVTIKQDEFANMLDVSARIIQGKAKIIDGELIDEDSSDE